MMFSGTGVALVTPFTKDNAVDFDALGKLIDHVIAGGVDYLVALGTTGETPTLTSEERRAVLRFIVEHTDRRRPVVAGMGSNNTAELLEGLRTYDFTGVSCLLSVTPYYNKPSQEGLYQHYVAYAAATDLPIILYNVPGRTGGNILPKTVYRLVREFQNIIAIKEASGNLAQCMELVANAPEGFAVLSGDDNLVLPQIAIGMHGVISVAANCYTQDFCAMVQFALVNQYEEARRLHYKLLSGIDMLFEEGNPAGVKHELARLGICENYLRLPLVPVSAGLAERMNRAAS